MPLDRRGFLVRSGLALAAAGVFGPEALVGAAETNTKTAPSWRAVRRQFLLRRDRVHLGGFLLASHPTPVRQAIERHRRRFDADPVDYLHRNYMAEEAAVLGLAAAYTGGRGEDIALTDSTTMGLSLLYNGIELGAGDDVLTSTHDFFVTHEALRLKAEQTGASVRKIQLYEEAANASADEIVRRVAAAVMPRTRVVALTWVHSSTGVKLPIRRIADALAPLNGGSILMCVDGVHGFGVEDVRLPELGCHFFVAGCHKWLFGPRGTGIVWGRPEAWPRVRTTIPSFTETGTPGSRMTPGGFHSFEHRWALADAFRFQLRIGKARVAARTHALNTRFKSGLAAMSHVTCHTPRSTDLSSGLVCFEVRGRAPEDVVDYLSQHDVIATVTPYVPSYARVSPSILNTPAEIDRTLGLLRKLA